MTRSFPITDDLTITADTTPGDPHLTLEWVDDPDLEMPVEIRLKLGLVKLIIAALAEAALWLTEVVVEEGL